MRRLSFEAARERVYAAQEARQFRETFDLDFLSMQELRRYWRAANRQYHLGHYRWLDGCRTVRELARLEAHDDQLR